MDLVGRHGDAVGLGDAVSVLSWDGLKSTIGSAAGVVAALVGQDIIAKSIRLTQAAALNAVTLATAGARMKFSDGGTTDFFSGDGATRITAAGILASATDVEVAANSALYLNGSTRTIGVSNDGTAIRVLGAVPVAPNADQGINLGSTALRWSNLFASIVNMTPGTATVTPVVAGGALNVNVTPVSSAGNGTDLMTYTMPANALTTALRGVCIEAWGTTTNNANAKTVALAFGGQTIITKNLAVSLANGIWHIKAYVIRTGVSAQEIFTEAWNNDAITVSGADGATVLYGALRTAGTQTETAAIVIKGVATNATTTDISQTGMIVSYF